MMLPNHIAVSYVAYVLSFGGTTKYVVPFLVASVIVDIDHIIPWLRRKKEGKKFRGANMRTRLHEMYGMVIVSTIVMSVWFYDTLLAQVLALALLLHYCIDFLAGETRPFYPYSETRVQLFFKKNPWKRVVLEITLLAVSIMYIIWLTSKN